MAKSSIPFSEIIIKYCVFHYGDIKGEEVYSYYAELSKTFGIFLDFNNILAENDYVDIYFILRAIEQDILKNDVKIYYRKFPYETGLQEEISYTDFMKSNNSFYMGKGECKLNNHSLRLELDSKILDCLLALDEENTLYSHKHWSNNHMKTSEKLYEMLRKNEKVIFEEYQKHYRDLTREQFRECISDVLQQKDVGQHISDGLWYSIRNESDKPRK